MNRQIFALCLSLSVVLACTPKTGKKIESPMPPSEPGAWSEGKPSVGSDDTQEITLDDIVVNGGSGGLTPLDSIRPYQAAATKAFKLEHTEIKIGFDFAKRHAPGQATLTLKPWFQPTNQLVLDAKNFEIKKVALAGGAPLQYKYDGMQLFITLDRTYTRNERVKVRVDYVARPDDRAKVGGSSAITSDKGLYFIDPDGTDPEKPTQIWTQGETESSSRWFPTIDKPNQRTTQEIYITVPDKYKTLSNGVLISANKNADGTRTDYYKLDKPHAPYLFMMAVGEFAKVSDRWRNIPVNYYVEPQYESVARDIFPYTPEMLEFFSNKLGYAYPWPSYSQVVVREYVSGAMENTTAVIFGEFMQQKKRDLLDVHWTNEKIVAHEMFHHWFGDLVTCESWSNLTLNEGFANYSEYLWLEHKYGREEADKHLEDELSGFLNGYTDGGHPPIHYHYNEKEDMFDGVSYAKGGCILHMLRKYLGDEAFFASLSYYLQKHEYTEVEAHELRMAFEEVTGEDLNWFFDQWYFKGGYPSLEINYDYYAASKEAIVTVTQTPTATDADQALLYEIPVFVDIYAKDGSRSRKSMRITKREQEVRFAVGEKPLVINFDAEKSLVCTKTDNHTPEEWMALFTYGPLYADRKEALAQFETLNKTQQSEIIKRALQDKSRAIRQQALSLSPNIPVETLKQLASTDPDPQVRCAALNRFGEKATLADLPMLKTNLQEDKPYSVVSEALGLIAKISRDTAILYSKSLQSESNDQIVSKLGELYHKSTSAEYLPWYQSKAKIINYDGSISFMEYYQKYLMRLNDAEASRNAVTNWEQFATSSAEGQWRRFASTKAVADMRNDLRKKGKLDATEQTLLDQCVNALKHIKSTEKDKTLLMYYEMF